MAPMENFTSTHKVISEEERLAELEEKLGHLQKQFKNPHAPADLSGSN